MYLIIGDMLSKLVIRWLWYQHIFEHSFYFCGELASAFSLLTKKDFWTACKIMLTEIQEKLYEQI